MTPDTLRLVDEALRRRDMLGAMSLAREALAQGVVHPKLLHLRSTWLEGQGRRAEALADLERARALAPDEPAVQMALGLLLARMSRTMEALHAFEAAARKRPDLQAAFFQIGEAAERLGELERARQGYGEALRLDADHAEAAARLASLAVQQGDWTAARSLAAHALALVPHHPIARLAEARADLETGDWSSAEARLNAMLADPDLTPGTRRLVQYALGELRHRQNQPAEAFAAWRTGADIARERYWPLYAGDAGAPALVRWLTSHFQDAPAWPPASNAAASKAAEHVFLLGFPRSGTTLLEQVLASHPLVTAMEEKEVLESAIHAFMSGPAQLAALRDADETMLEPYRRAYWRAVGQYGLNPAGRVFIDKSPFNTLRLPLIARLFPRAKVLLAVRDPRDVVLSCFRTAFRINALTFEFLDIVTAARFYDGVMALAESYQRKLPLTVCVTRHEDLLDDLEAEGRRICDFLGLEWRAEMVDFASRPRAREIATPSANQVRQGLSRAGVGQWRRYAKEMEPALPMLAPWAAHFGYAP